MARARTPRLSWFRTFADDFLGGVHSGALSATECGTYWLLLLAQWGSKERKAVSADPDDLKRYCLGEAPSRKVLRKFEAVEVDGDKCLRNKRMAAEWDSAWSEFSSKSKGGVAAAERLPEGAESGADSGAESVPKPKPHPDPPTENDNGLSAPPAPSLVCPNCGHDTIRPHVDGGWWCSDVHNAGACREFFDADDPGITSQLVAAVAGEDVEGGSLPAGVKAAAGSAEDGARKKPRGGYVGRAMELWREATGGEIAPGRMGRALEPLVKRLLEDPDYETNDEAWAFLEPMLVVYLRETDHRYARPEGWAAAPRAAFDKQRGTRE